MTQTNPPVRGVIFDLGDTLISVPRAIDDELAIARIGNVSEEKLDFLNRQLCVNRPGLSSTEFIDALCDLADIQDVELRREAHAAARHSVAASILQPDAIPCLANLKARGLKLCLVSNTNPLSWDRVRLHGLDPYFDEIVFSCDTGLAKPDPRIFKMAFDRLSLSPDEVCSVGDKVRTIVLGVAHLGTRAVLVERRAKATVTSSRLVVEAMVPDLFELNKLQLFGGPL